jgi:tetratricopeptide (TPR) repeat protein
MKVTEALFPTEDLDTILTMIDVAVALGDEESTLELCDAARTVAPDDAEVLLTHADVLADLDRIDQARAVLELCTQRHGDISAVWQRLGGLCLDAGDAERAIEAFRQWQRLDGVNPDNEVALAWAYFVDLQLDKARHHAAGARSGDAGDDVTDIHARLAAIGDQAALESDAGWWLCGRGALDSGVPLLRASVDRRDDPGTRHRLGVALMASGAFDEATAQLRLATDAEPTQFEWLDDLGTAQLLDGDLDGADTTFDTLRANLPSAGEGPVGSGRVALRRGDPERALEVADDVIGVDTESADAWIVRANALLMLDRAPEALVSAEHAIALAADDRVAWSTAADAADAAGSSAIAARYRGRAGTRLSGSLGIAEGGITVGAEIADELHELDRFVVADPLIREIYRHRSGIALELGLPDRALRYLRAAIERGVLVESADSLCDEGTLLLMAGHAEAARRQFERVLADDPDHHRALAGWREAQQGDAPEMAEAVDELAPEPEHVVAAEPWVPSHEVPPTGMAAFGEPGGTATALTQLEPGLPVQLLERSKRWVRVRFENGWECWVEAILLVARTDRWSPTHRVPADGLAAFATPFEGGAVVAQLDPGLELELLARVDAWAHVRFENGWSCWTDGGPLEVLR